jgi:hypothetical protein
MGAFFIRIAESSSLFPGACLPVLVYDRQIESWLSELFEKRITRELPNSFLAPPLAAVLEAAGLSRELAVAEYPLASKIGGFDYSA